MRAVRIPTAGPIGLIDVAEPTHDDATAFLADLYTAIGCDSVECVRLTDFDAWLDETGLIDGRPLNPRATQLARANGGTDELYGVVVILGANPDTGEPCSLTNDQVEQAARMLRLSAPAPASLLANGKVRDAASPQTTPQAATQALGKDAANWRHNHTCGDHEVSRAEVEARWVDVLAGRTTREDACRWAEPLMLGDNPIDDIMTAQGLQYLHGLDLAHHGDPNVVHHGQPGVYLRTDADVARELQRWRQRCRDYDTDPAAWSCRGRGRD